MTTTFGGREDGAAKRQNGRAMNRSAKNGALVVLRSGLRGVIGPKLHQMCGLQNAQNDIFHHENDTSGMMEVGGAAFDELAFTQIVAGGF
jgi:hypothetical protein